MRSTVKKKLGTFQLKGLSKILRMKTTHVNKNNTNKRVLQAANNNLAMERYQANIEREVTERRKVKMPRTDFWGIRKSIRPLSEEYEYLRNKHFAKILCKGNPLKKLIFKSEELERYDHGNKDMEGQDETG